ncbi:hypothetical protein [Sphingomonas yabuuchiae]
MIPVEQVASIPDAAPVKREASAMVGPVVLIRRPCTIGPTDDDVVVCGRRDDARFRLGPMPPPPSADGMLSRPLRIQIAPGVSFGFQKGGGFGLRTEFGPGRKTGEGE